MKILKRILNVIALLSFVYSPIGLYFFFNANYEDGIFFPVASLLVVFVANYILFGRATLWNKID